MKMKLINCPACTYIYDTKQHSQCPNCDGVIDQDETITSVNNDEIMDAISRNTHATRAIGLFLMLSAVNMLAMCVVFFFSSMNVSSTPMAAAATAASVGFVIGLITLITVGRELGYSKSR
jgi:predicted nucleic acid-binding Zn ribbon protein